MTYREMVEYLGGVNGDDPEDHEVATGRVRRMAGLGFFVARLKVRKSPYYRVAVAVPCGRLEYAENVRRTMGGRGRIEKCTVIFEGKDVGLVLYALGTPDNVVSKYHEYVSVRAQDRPKGEIDCAFIKFHNAWHRAQRGVKMLKRT